MRLDRDALDGASRLKHRTARPHSQGFRCSIPFINPVRGDGGKVGKFHVHEWS